MVERGIILAGGNGSRMMEMTNGLNKHTLPVGGRPMIDYPLQTLKDMGIDKVTIVSNQEGIPKLEQVIDEPDLDIEFRLQKYPNGMADALGCAAVKEDVFVVLCGDTYHDPAPKLTGDVQLWWTRGDGLNQGAIWNPRENRIEEKPKEHNGMAIIGARVYDQSALELIKDLKPSARGELELVDIDNHYLANELEMSYYQGFFGDMGTVDGLFRVVRHLRSKA
jgi:glucose-1-phosphate thymidylyltransferase